MTGEVLPVLHAENLTKRYGGVTALEGVDLTIHRGEIRALLGANGAGKSTLVKLLSGNVMPDIGTITVAGTTRRFASPRSAFGAGIATVHQELSLFAGLSVAQNIFIGREERGRFGQIRERAVLARAEALLDQLGVADIRAEAKVGTLSLAQRQLVEIAKAMAFDPEVLILDEPTSALGLSDVRRLLTVVGALKARGRAILFISHRMEEIETIADAITILRSGRKVGDFSRSAFSRERALELMLGETQEQLHGGPPPVAVAEAATPVLRVTDLHLGGRLRGVSFDLRAGEVLGFAGLEGQGQKDTLFALFGLFRRGLSGEVAVRGHNRRARRPLQAIDAGFAFIPDDRKNMGGLMFLSVGQNISITMLDYLRRFPFLSFRLEQTTVRTLIRRLQIKAASAGAALASLSGGNQQKVVVAKWLVPERDIYLFCDPTRGVDAGARETIYATIRELAAGGKAVILYSTDMVEFPILCSRVLVFRGGKIAGSVKGDAINEEAILALSFREEQAAA